MHPHISRIPVQKPTIILSIYSAVNIRALVLLLLVYRTSVHLCRSSSTCPCCFSKANVLSHVTCDRCCFILIGLHLPADLTAPLQSLCPSHPISSIQLNYCLVSLSRSLSVGFIRKAAQYQCRARPPSILHARQACNAA